MKPPLTEERKKEIRRRYWAGEPVPKLAAEFGIPVSAVNRSTGGGRPRIPNQKGSK